MARSNTGAGGTISTAATGSSTKGSDCVSFVPAVTDSHCVEEETCSMTSTSVCVVSVINSIGAGAATTSLVFSSSSCCVCVWVGWWGDDGDDAQVYGATVKKYLLLCNFFQRRLQGF